MEEVFICQPKGWNEHMLSISRYATVSPCSMLIPDPQKIEAFTDLGILRNTS